MASQASALVVGEEGGDGLLHGADAARLQGRDALQGVAEVPPLRARDAQQRRMLPHLQSAYAAVSVGPRAGSMMGQQHHWMARSEAGMAFCKDHAEKEAYIIT